MRYFSDLAAFSGPLATVAVSSLIASVPALASSPADIDDIHRSRGALSLGSPAAPERGGDPERDRLCRGLRFCALPAPPTGRTRVDRERQEQEPPPAASGRRL